MFSINCKIAYFMFKAYNLLIATMLIQVNYNYETFFTFENIFDDRVIVGIGPAGTNNPENIEQSSSGISDDPS